jgi:hypothetical protein
MTIVPFFMAQPNFYNNQDLSNERNQNGNENEEAAATAGKKSPRKKKDKNAPVDNEHEKVNNKNDEDLNQRGLNSDDDLKNGEEGDDDEENAEDEYEQEAEMRARQTRQGLFSRGFFGPEYFEEKEEYFIDGEEEPEDEINEDENKEDKKEESDANESINKSAKNLLEKKRPRRRRLRVDPNYKWLLKDLNLSDSRRMMDVTELIEENEKLNKSQEEGAINSELNKSNENENKSQHLESSNEEKTNNSIEVNEEKENLNKKDENTQDEPKIPMPKISTTEIDNSILYDVSLPSESANLDGEQELSAFKDYVESLTSKLDKDEVNVESKPSSLSAVAAETNSNGESIPPYETIVNSDHLEILNEEGKLPKETITSLPSLFYEGHDTDVAKKEALNEYHLDKSIDSYDELGLDDQDESKNDNDDDEEHILERESINKLYEKLIQENKPPMSEEATEANTRNKQPELAKPLFSTYSIKLNNPEENKNSKNDNSANNGLDSNKEEKDKLLADDTYKSYESSDLPSMTGGDSSAEEKYENSINENTNSGDKYSKSFEVSLGELDGMIERVNNGIKLKRHVAATSNASLNNDDNDFKEIEEEKRPSDNKHMIIKMMSLSKTNDDELEAEIDYEGNGTNELSSTRLDSDEHQNQSTQRSSSEQPCMKRTAEGDVEIPVRLVYTSQRRASANSSGATRNETINRMDEEQRQMPKQNKSFADEIKLNILSSNQRIQQKPTLKATITISPKLSANQGTSLPISYASSSSINYQKSSTLSHSRSPSPLPMNFSSTVGQQQQNLTASIVENAKYISNLRVELKEKYERQINELKNFYESELRDLKKELDYYRSLKSISRTHVSGAPGSEEDKNLINQLKSANNTLTEKLVIKCFNFLYA